MTLTLLKAKIHRARVTGADLDYEGSIVIDSSLLEMSGILPHEMVHVWNRTNGNRFETYAISAPPGSGTIMVNGAAAHLVNPGDIVIISAFAQYTPDESRTHHPTVVLADDRNRGRLK
jgi:aspartate 1-decarboxylase